jgi:rhamnulokinase
MTEPPIHLAVDLGASGGRVLACRFEPQVELEEVHRFPNGPITIGQRQLWDVIGLWKAIELGLRLAGQKYGARVKSVGVASWGVDYCLLDRLGDVVGHPVCYRDHRTDGIFASAWERISRERMFAETGLQFLEFNTAFQLLAMRLEQSPLLDIADRWLMIPDFFHWLLSGQVVNEYTNASTTQLLRAEDGQWSQEIMQAFEIPAHLFGIPVQPGTVLGPLRPALAAACGLPETQVVVPATHDTASAVLAVPADQFAPERPDWCYISSGTWSLMGTELPRPVLTEVCARHNFTNEGGAAGSIRLLKNISGLWPLQQCRLRWELLGRSYSWEQLIGMAEQSPGLRTLFDPDNACFVSPDDMPAEIFAFCERVGEPLPVDDAGVARAALDSLVMRYRLTLARLEEVLGHRLERIHIVGGGSQNRLLCQMTADACQRPVVAGPAEATAIGNVMLQKIGLGDLASIVEARRLIRGSAEICTFEPGPGDVWEAAEQRFLKLIDA